jgi:hypothetical protein
MPIDMLLWPIVLMTGCSGPQSTLDPAGPSAATRLVAVGGGVDLKYTAGPPDRNAPLAAHLVSQLALTDRLQSFRRTAS